MRRKRGRAEIFISLDGDPGTREVSADFWEVPTAAQMVNGEALLHVNGGLVVARDCFLALGPTFAPISIAGSVAAFPDGVPGRYNPTRCTTPDRLQLGVAFSGKCADGKRSQDFQPFGALLQGNHRTADPCVIGMALQFRQKEILVPPPG